MAKMSTPDVPFVPWSIFQWIVTAFAAVIAWLFRQHLRDDDRRFEKQEARMSLLHAENVGTMEKMRGDVLAAQNGLSSQIMGMRREIVDVLLQQRRD